FNPNTPHHQHPQHARILPGGFNPKTRIKNTILPVTLPRRDKFRKNQHHHELNRPPHLEFS
ncbi:hypothetical protein, partial [Mobiluncus mulieris]